MLQVTRDLRLRRTATRRFTRMFAGIVREKIRTNAAPTPTELVAHTEAVYQVFGPVDRAASARLRPGNRGGGGANCCIFHNCGFTVYVGAVLHHLQRIGHVGRMPNRASCLPSNRMKLMTKNNRKPQAPTSFNIDRLVHAIALAMARRQMQIAWPRR